MEIANIYRAVGEHYSSRASTAPSSQTEAILENDRVASAFRILPRNYRLFLSTRISDCHAAIPSPRNLKEVRHNGRKEGRKEVLLPTVLLNRSVPASVLQSPGYMSI